MKSSSLCEELAAILHKEFSGDEESEFVGHSGRNESGLVVIIDRRLDLVTPILNQVNHRILMMSLMTGIVKYLVTLKKRDKGQDGGSESQVQKWVWSPSHHLHIFVLQYHTLMLLLTQLMR